MSKTVTPDYYWLPITEGGQRLQIEAISGLLGHYLGSVVDYLWRAGRKPGESAFSDLAKARNWLDKGRRGDRGLSMCHRMCLLRHLRTALRAWAQTEPGVSDVDKTRVDAIFRVTDVAINPHSEVWWDSTLDWIALLERQLSAAGAEVAP